MPRGLLIVTRRRVAGGEPVVEREHDGRRPVADAELGKDMADVTLDGGLADEQLVRDLRVARAPADEPQDVNLTGVSCASAADTSGASGDAVQNVASTRPVTAGLTAS